MPSPPANHHQRQPAARVWPALRVWASLAALLFAIGVSPFLHESLHERLAGHEHRQAGDCRPAGTQWLDAARPGHEHHACPICLALAGFHLAAAKSSPDPAPGAMANRRSDVASPLRLGLLQPLGFRHRGPPALV
ncbi:MAG: hypothetical protein ACOZHQ_13185 [Thermodesulfobacteriota bacterium]